ncbi:hypothetical protein ALC56_11123, partial [Trachymyrmex septentrionalis]
CSGLEAFGRVHAYTLLTTIARVDDESPLAECKRLGLALRTSVRLAYNDGDVNNSVPPRPARASLASPSSSGDDVAVVVVVAVAVVVVAVVSAALLSRSVKTTATVLGDVT